MTGNSIEFGYYSRHLEVTAGPVAIRTLPGLENTVGDVEADPGVEGDWIYAPPQRVRQMGGGIAERPYPSRIFGLPRTHSLAHPSPDGPDHLVFHLWALSFFTGARLTATEAGFVDATPIRPGKLVDFVLLGDGLARAVDLAETFWSRHRSEPRRARLVAAAVHALFLGQNPLLLQFERFLLFYTAFDACFALAKSIHRPRGQIFHAARVSWMCGLHGMAVPPWADPAAPSGPEVASLRNETVHEALFMGEPLGFALHGSGTSRNLTLEMEALICRLLVALLGAHEADYVQSAIDTRQVQGLRFG